MAADLATTRTAMATFAASASRADADAAGVAMAKLETTTNTHLDHEEATSEPIYQKEHDHPAIKEMGKKFSRRTGIPRAGVFMAWLEDGATAEEKAGAAGQRPRPGGDDHRRAVRPGLPQGGRARLGVVRLPS